MTDTPKHRTAMLVDCRDLDKFIEEKTGRKWDTLEVAGPRGQDYISGNGMMDDMEVRWTPDLWEPPDPDDEWYSDTIWGQLELVEQWLETGVADQYLRTDSILCYLVREGKMKPGNYVIHLWW